MPGSIIPGKGLYNRQSCFNNVIPVSEQRANIGFSPGSIFSIPGIDENNIKTIGIQAVSSKFIA